MVIPEKVTYQLIQLILLYLLVIALVFVNVAENSLLKDIKIHDT